MLKRLYSFIDNLPIKSYSIKLMNRNHVKKPTSTNGLMSQLVTSIIFTWEVSLSGFKSRRGHLRDMDSF